MPTKARTHGADLKARSDRTRTRRAGRCSPRWQRLRLLVIRRDMVCPCGAALTRSSPVDHIVAVSAGGEEYDADNLQGLCKPCHDRKTVVEDGGMGRVKR